MSTIIPPSYTPLLNEAIFEIGAWNMDTTSTKSIAHGLGDIRQKCRSISVMIGSDAFTSLSSFFDTNNAGSGNVNVDLTSTAVVMTRETGGKFDSTAFDDPAQNRGWVHILYTD